MINFVSGGTGFVGTAIVGSSSVGNVGVSSNRFRFSLKGYYFKAEFNASSYTLVDDYYVFVAKTGNESVKSDNLKVCEDLDNCVFTTDGGGDDDDDVDCASQWDCSAVSWGECDEVTRMKTRDLDLCVQPTSQECLDDTSSYPDDSMSCIPEGEDEEDVEEDVPVFGWLNMLIVVFCLVGYYFYKK